MPIRRFPLPRRVLYESWQWLRTPSVERATGRVDVVHDAGYVVPPSKAPLVTTVHDLAFLTYPHHYTWHSRRVLLRGLELTRRHARLVMCPSLATKAACEDAGIAAERLRVVPLGVRVHPPQPELSEQVRRRYRLERPFVLFVGTVEPRKNLHRVIEAFRALDAADTELILVGPQGWREDIDVALDGLHGGARTLGYLPRDELDVLYARATAVVYPSLAEGFGLPVLEAMANGAAVVTSAGTATEEVAGNAALLVDPLDVDAIAEALQRLIDDRALAAALGAAARARASTFTWDRSAELAVAVYAEAIEASR